MTKLKTHTFNGQRFEVSITESGIGGICTAKPRKGRPEIIIGVPLDTQQGIITAIHEALHASKWHTQEETVSRLATDIGRFLWRLGYRHTAN